jgi:hypothetical protein
MYISNHSPAAFAYRSPVRALTSIMLTLVKTDGKTRCSGITTAKSLRGQDIQSLNGRCSNSLFQCFHLIKITVQQNLAYVDIKLIFRIKCLGDITDI